MTVHFLNVTVGADSKELFRGSAYARKFAQRQGFIFSMDLDEPPFRLFI
jgi:hypothetical protein